MDDGTGRITITGPATGTGTGTGTGRHTGTTTGVTVDDAVPVASVLELVHTVEGAEPAEPVKRGTGHGHSHSMVPGGFDVMSSATRLTPSTSLMMREDRRSRRS